MEQFFSGGHFFEGSADLETSAGIARRLAAELRPGDVVTLAGELGSGKTTFVRMLARALHGRDEVSSPTFTLRHTYAGEPPVEHLDFYRIEDARETPELGLDEAFESGAIVLIEWPERMPGLVPRHRVEVVLGGSGDEPRTIAVRDAR